MTSYEVVGQRPAFTGESGAASENRTPDLLITSETLHAATSPDSLDSDAPSVADVSSHVSDLLETLPNQADVDALADLLDLMTNFPSNDQRARYLLTCNWMRDRDQRLYR